jgi:hypothetical protein
VVRLTSQYRKKTDIIPNSSHAAKNDRRITLAISGWMFLVWMLMLLSD